MKIEIDLKQCKSNSISPNQYVLLYLMYHKEYSTIEEVFGRINAVVMRDKLTETKFILNKEKVPFKSTTLSTNHVCKLLGIRSDTIQFMEFYNTYPMKVGSRVLRPANIDTIAGRKHEKKYLDKIKTKEAHERAIKATITFVAKQKQAGKLNYLPAMETVLNNAMLESWEVLIEKRGEEGLEWNTQSI